MDDVHDAGLKLTLIVELFGTRWKLRLFGGGVYTRFTEGSTLKSTIFNGPVSTHGDSSVSSSWAKAELKAISTKVNSDMDNVTCLMIENFLKTNTPF